MTALNAVGIVQKNIQLIPRQMKPFQKQFNIGTTGPLVSVMFSLYSV